MSPDPEALSVQHRSIDGPPWRSRVIATLLLAVLVVLCANVGSAVAGLIMVALAAVGSGCRPRHSRFDRNMRGALRRRFPSLQRAISHAEPRPA
jgi:hypothetical protein